MSPFDDLILFIFDCDKLMYVWMVGVTPTVAFSMSKGCDGMEFVIVRTCDHESMNLVVAKRGYRHWVLLEVVYGMYTFFDNFTIVIFYLHDIIKVISFECFDCDKHVFVTVVVHASYVGGGCGTVNTHAVIIFKCDVFVG